MAEPTIQLGGGNWAGKSDNLLGYYKEGERFYKQDFTFSRSTTGTYTDSDGYIQEMPYNLLQQSNQFDTTWSNSGYTLTSGQSDRNGGTDAWLANCTAAGNALYQSNTSSGVLTFSIYAKEGTQRYIRVRADISGVNDPETRIDLNDGSIDQQSNVIDVNVTDAGNGYYRIEITFVGTSLINVQLRPVNSSGSNVTGTIYIQDAQLVKGTSAKTYFPTTTRLNMPRVSYKDNSNGSLILEPQRTNLITYSESFGSGSGWSLQANVTLTSNSAISPDGTLNATKLVGNGTNGIYRYVTASGVISKTIYIKSVVGNVNVKLKDPGGTDEKTVNVTTQWQRFDLIGSNSTSTSGLWLTNIPSSGIYIWGAQLEVGSYPTSLINTKGSSVTRNADVCSLTNVADRINSSEGVLFVETSYANKGYGNSIAITDGTNSQRVQIYFNNSNLSLLLVVKVNDTIVGTHTVSSSGINWDNTNKIAIKYKTNDMSFWLNGTKVAEDTSGTMFSANTLTKLGFDSGSGGSFYGKCNQIQVYSTALSDSELAALTTI